MAKEGDRPLRPTTRLTLAGRREEWTFDPRIGGGIVNPPVWRASTTLYANVADLKSRMRDTHDQLFYGRRGTPTIWALADALTALEPGAQGTLLFPSGVAALGTALLALLKPGDHLLMVDSVYDPTRTLCNGMLHRMGIETTFYDATIGGGIAALIRPTTRLIFMESPGSQTFEVQDVPAIVAAAKAAGVPTMIDNTWAGPLYFSAMAHGVDVSMISATKHVAGHSDLLMGALTVAPGLWQILRQISYELGQTVSADDAALALRGMRTMALRQEQAGRSALIIAQWLAARPEIGTVLFPALPGAPGHDLWRRDFTGACGLLSITLKDADDAARARFIDALTLFGIGYSFGGYESLATPCDPTRTTGQADWDGPLVRLAIGLEDQADLIADIEQALAAI